MIYVHQHSTSHLKSKVSTAEDAKGTGWKFNKVLQKWLVKNVWGEEHVPEAYVGMVVGYLKTIQGLGRAVSRATISFHAAPSSLQCSGQWKAHAVYRV